LKIKIDDKKAGLLQVLKNQRYILTMYIRFVIWLIIFRYIPLWGWVMGFQEFKPGQPTKWVGFAQFIKLFQEPQFYLTLRNTIVMSLVNLVFGTICAIAFALFLNETIRDQYSDFEKEVLKGYGSITTWKALFKSDFPFKKYGNARQINIPSGSEMQELFQKVQYVNWKRIPECIACKPSEFDKKWDAYQEELVKTGVHKLEDQCYELIKVRIEFWSDWRKVCSAAFLNIM
jgi:hypothetical protein